MSVGTATCSLHVQWWYPSRSAAWTTATTSPNVADSSHCAWARGKSVSTGVTMPSFTRRKLREDAVDRGDERGDVRGRFTQTVGLGEVHHRLEEDAEHADRDGRGLGTGRGARVGARPQVADEVGDLAPDATAQGVDLRRGADAFEEDDARRRGIGHQAVDIAADAHLGQAVVG